MKSELDSTIDRLTAKLLPYLLNWMSNVWQEPSFTRRNDGNFPAKPCSRRCGTTTVLSSLRMRSFVSFRLTLKKVIIVSVANFDRRLPLLVVDVVEYFGAHAFIQLCRAFRAAIELLPGSIWKH